MESLLHDCHNPAYSAYLLRLFLFSLALIIFQQQLSTGFSTLTCSHVPNISRLFFWTLLQLYTALDSWTSSTRDPPAIDFNLKTSMNPVSSAKKGGFIGVDTATNTNKDQQAPLLIYQYDEHSLQIEETTIVHDTVTAHVREEITASTLKEGSVRK